MKPFDKPVSWFNKIGDFGQRLQGVIWLAGILITGVGFLIGSAIKFQLSDVSAELKASIYFVFILLLGVTLVALLIYIVTVKIKQAKQNQAIKDASEQATMHLLEEEYWMQLALGDKTVDNYLISALQSPSSNRAQKRADCLYFIMTTCQQNILQQITQVERRVSFLEYPQIGDSFTLIAGCGIEHDTSMEVKRNLTIHRGVAAKAIETGEPVYLGDVRDQKEATDKGYVQVGRVSRFRSIVCVGVWLEGKPLGVICADCKEENAFLDSDIQVLEFLRLKVQLIYTLYPLS